jgi:hypothetical protein
MSDLHERFRTLDHLPQPDLWDEIEARALAAPTESVSQVTPTMAGASAKATPPWSATRATSILIVVGLVLAAIAVGALVASGARPQPKPIPAEIPARGPLASPVASLAVNVGPQGAWVATGGMVHRRTEGHSVTLLADGRVLVAGGGGAEAGNAWKTAELYDPATGTWTATGNMLESRHDHTATLLPDGRVLVAGGLASFATDGVLASAEVYDPGTGTWTATASMTGTRHGHAASLLADGRVLLAGGHRDRGAPHPAVVATTEIFDPATGSWAAPREMPRPHATDSLTATLLLDGRVLFVGSSAQLYDPMTASWAATSPMERGRFGHTATLLRDGRVLVAGLGFPLWADAELYDPETDAWTRTSDMNERRAWFAAGLLPDGRVLVAGSGDGAYAGSPTAEIYDPATATWSLTPDMQSAHGHHGGVTLDDGRFLVVGGFPRGEPSAETYDVIGDR